MSLSPYPPLWTPVLSISHANPASSKPFLVAGSFLPGRVRVDAERIGQPPRRVVEDGPVDRPPQHGRDQVRAAVGVAERCPWVAAHPKGENGLDRVLGLQVHASVIDRHPRRHGEELSQRDRLLRGCHDLDAFGQQFGQGLVESQSTLVDSDSDQDADHALGHRVDVGLLRGLAVVVVAQCGVAVDADQDGAYRFQRVGPVLDLPRESPLDGGVVDPGGWSGCRAGAGGELAEAQVLRIQTKLHQWAGDDPGRRFDDLFNLVCDPAVLVVAWDRVRGNRGKRSAGVDGWRPAVDPGRGEAFLSG